MAYVTSVEKIGFKRGQQEAQKEAQERIEKIVLKMIEEQVPLETIAKVTELSIAQIQQIQVQQA
jgi:hypothetical protein